MNTWKLKEQINCLVNLVKIKQKFMIYHSKLMLNLKNTLLVNYQSYLTASRSFDNPNSSKKMFKGSQLKSK